MAKLVDRLTALEVKRLTKVGLHPDGRGLYLQVDKGGAKSWIYRYTLNGRVRAMGLGPTHRISLAAARGLASRARDLKAEGIDPIDHRQESRPKPQVAAPPKPVFKKLLALSAVDSRRAVPVLADDVAPHGGRHHCRL